MKKTLFEIDELLLNFVIWSIKGSKQMQMKSALGDAFTCHFLVHYGLYSSSMTIHWLMVSTPCHCIGIHSVAFSFQIKKILDLPSLSVLPLHCLCGSYLKTFLDFIWQEVIISFVLQKIVQGAYVYPFISCDLLDHNSIATIHGFYIPKPKVSFHIDKTNNDLFSKNGFVF